MISEVIQIKTALKVTALGGEQTVNTPSTTVTEDAPLLPYEEMGRKPTDLPMEEYSLKPAGDLRRMKPIADQLKTITDKIETIDETLASLKQAYDAKVMEVKTKEGYEETKQDLTKATARAAEEIQREFTEVAASYGESKRILLEYQERVYTIFDNLSKKKVSDTEKLDLMEQTLTKLLSADLVKSINDLVDTGVKQLETAKTTVQRRFVSFPSRKDIRKLVKEELPKKMESLKAEAGSVMDFLTGLWTGIKSLFTPIKDNAAELQSLLETEVEPLLNVEGVTATKKTAESNDRLLLQKKFDDRHEAAAYMIELFGAENLLDQLIAALGDDAAFDHLGYIARMNDLNPELGQLPDVR